jgi:hypothetical protein
MAFTGNFLCTSFKKELMTGTHNFTATTGNTFNIALYTNSASFTAATTAYTTSNEISGTNYSAKGAALNPVTPTTSGTTALVDFADETFSTVTISSVRGGLIFNDTATGDPSVAVLDFGSDKSASGGDFTIVFPTADASNAIIRIA